ncbi:hypothetical protein ACFU8W_17175 [Streptomyces sp. NPDC057565]|uniref:hypothetical protein n=1 Tax=Streptomyces sp. NPDC057565 TaxID=3346169 RepID=UPI0036C998A5
MSAKLPVRQQLLPVQQQKVRLGPQQTAVQPPDQLDGGALRQIQCGPQFRPLCIDLRGEGVTDVLLGPGDSGEQPLLPVAGRQRHVVAPARQSGQHLQRLVHAAADQACRAVRRRVQHRPVRIRIPAHEIGAARVAPRYGGQGRAGRQHHVLHVIGATEVEVEGERGQFGQLAVVPQQLEGTVGHVTERNSGH